MWGECGRGATMARRHARPCAGHPRLASSVKKTWMAGRKGVHARLRRAMPGHDEPLRPLQRPQCAHGPLALVDAAGVALQPGFGALADIAREEIAAGETVL